MTWTLRAKQLPLLGSNLQILGQTVAELTVVKLPVMKLPHPIVLVLLVATIDFIAMNVQAWTYLQKNKIQVGARACLVERVSEGESHGTHVAS